MGGGTAVGAVPGWPGCHLPRLPPPTGLPRRLAAAGSAGHRAPWGLYLPLRGVVEEEAWENQRRYPLVGWSDRLLPAERPAWSPSGPAGSLMAQCWTDGVLKQFICCVTAPHPRPQKLASS